MKICKRCNVEKPFTDFYVHKAMTDGYLSFCKECTKSRVLKHREQNIEYVREYDRKRGSLPKRIEARKIYAQTENGKKSKANSLKRYREKHTDRYFAHTAFRNAVRDGKVIPQPCFICGNEKSEGHHPDYSRPLDVVWLCNFHHREVHKLKKD